MHAPPLRNIYQLCFMSKQWAMFSHCDVQKTCKKSLMYEYEYAPYAGTKTPYTIGIECVEIYESCSDK